MTVSTPQAPRTSTAGTWKIDEAHSEIAFSVRHTMVGRVRGEFTAFDGQVVVGETPLGSCAHVRIDMGSVDTGNPRRDDHLRSPDFFDVAAFPKMTFRSTALRAHGPRYQLDGRLTVKDNTKPISFDVALGSFRCDPAGDLRVRAAVAGALDRSDFGVDFNLVLHAGGVLVANRVEIHMDIEAVLAR
jgi:polyisoprenoid-binding protein YceI